MPQDLYHPFVRAKGSGSPMEGFHPALYKYYGTLVSRLLLSSSETSDGSDRPRNLRSFEGIEDMVLFAG